jgi:hypothetical protein
MTRGKFLRPEMKDIPYNQGMDDSVRQLIVREAEKRGESLAALSKKLGKNHAYLQQFVKRGTPTELPERVRRSLAGLLQIEEGELRGSAELGAPPPAAGYRPPQRILGASDLKVFAAVEGGPGEMVVSTDPIDLVPRPWYMGQVRDGFAVLVVGDSMVPAFEPGELAIVNPRLPPKRNDDVILISGEDEGEFRASIKRLINWDAKSWRLKQYNPAREFSWTKKDWPKALSVVGKYRGG